MQNLELRKEAFMPEETVTSAPTAEATTPSSVTAPEQFESPPPAAAPERRDYDPRARLHELALELVRTQNRRLLIEYLRLRRASR
jgi:hypothetical protein